MMNGEKVVVAEDITIADVFKYMVDFKNYMSTKLEDKIGGLEEKIQLKMGDMEREIVKNQNENKEMFEETNARMRKLEQEMLKMKGPTNGSETLKKMELEWKIRDGEEKKRENELEKKLRRARLEEEREKLKEKERHERKRRDEEKVNNLQKELALATEKEGSQSYEWESEASEWLDQQVRPVNTKLRKEDALKKKKKTTKGGMTRLKNWFGDSDDSEESEEEDTVNEWNVIGRKEKNIEKKKKAEERRKRKRENVTRKARNIIGIGPIHKDSIEHFQREGLNLEEAKIEALKEHLKFFLHYTEDDLEELKIGATQICAKDNILYVALESHDDIKEIHTRTAEQKDDRIQLRNFIPPQYFNRYMFLSKRCKELRDADNRKKTQLRFNNGDVEILVKDKGSQESYKSIPHEQVCNLEDLPDYDHLLEWKPRKDRMTRQEHRSPNRGAPPSLCGKEVTSHPVSRGNSIESAPKKKLKLSQVTAATTNDTIESDMDDESL